MQNMQFNALDERELKDVNKSGHTWLASMLRFGPRTLLMNGENSMAMI
jgi:hypothetical protein